jgi:DNA-binding response OmpR family regulator
MIQSPVDPAARIADSAASPPTALVIDGDPVVARSLERMFQDQTFVVRTARLGAEGVLMATARPYSLIVLGADLPDMSGLEAMNQLRMAGVSAAIVFASVTPATVANAAMMHLSDCS